MCNFFYPMQVVVRIRPLNSLEKGMQDFRRCLKQQSAQNISWIGQQETRFSFDYVACETINQVYSYHLKMSGQ